MLANLLNWWRNAVIVVGVVAPIGHRTVRDASAEQSISDVSPQRTIVDVSTDRTVRDY